jgi:hypothetical protein
MALCQWIRVFAMCFSHTARLRPSHRFSASHPSSDAQDAAFAGDTLCSWIQQAVAARLPPVIVRDVLVQLITLTRSFPSSLQHPDALHWPTVLITAWFSSFSFFESFYLVISGVRICTIPKVLRPVRVINMFSSLASCTRTLTSSCLKNPQTTPTGSVLLCPFWPRMHSRCVSRRRMSQQTMPRRRHSMHPMNTVRVRPRLPRRSSRVQPSCQTRDWRNLMT